jgi:hypothetical protein
MFVASRTTDMAKSEKAARREAGAFGVDPVTGKMRKLAVCRRLFTRPFAIARIYT